MGKRLETARKAIFAAMLALALFAWAALGGVVAWLGTIVENAHLEWIGALMAASAVSLGVFAWLRRSGGESMEAEERS